MKKFTNLDTLHHEAISDQGDHSLDDSFVDEDFSDGENSQMDISDKRKRRSAVADSIKRKKEADIDSLVPQEPLDQMLEETPNHIIYN